MKSEELSAAMTNGVKCLAFKPDMDSQFLVGTEVGLCTCHCQLAVEDFVEVFIRRRSQLAHSPCYKMY